MHLFIHRSLCALKRIVSKSEHERFGATIGIQIETLGNVMYTATATDGRRLMIVQGMCPERTPNWDGFKELPDDSCLTILRPSDLERAIKAGDAYLNKTFGVIGLATTKQTIHLGVGDDCIAVRPVEGRFPNVKQVIPNKKPLVSFRLDPKLTAETLLAFADMLPETQKGVELFYYGEGIPVGICAKNCETGEVYDALIVPLVKNENPKIAEAKNRFEHASARYHAAIAKAASIKVVGSPEWNEQMHAVSDARVEVERAEKDWMDAVSPPLVEDEEEEHTDGYTTEATNEEDHTEEAQEAEAENEEAAASEVEPDHVIEDEHEPTVPFKKKRGRKQTE